MRTSAVLITLALAASPVAQAQVVEAPAATGVAQPAAEPGAAHSPAAPTEVVAPTSDPSASPAVAAAPLSALEDEACRRLEAEAQAALEMALAPPPEAKKDEKPMTRSQGVGALTGSVAGQVAGAAVAGPIGAAVGALVVSKVGKTVAGAAEQVVAPKKKDEPKPELTLAGTPGPKPELLQECRARSETRSAEAPAAPTVATEAALTPVSQ